MYRLTGKKLGDIRYLALNDAMKPYVLRVLLPYHRCLPEKSLLANLAMRGRKNKKEIVTNS